MIFQTEGCHNFFQSAGTLCVCVCVCAVVVSFWHHRALRSAWTWSNNTVTHRHTHTHTHTHAHTHTHTHTHTHKHTHSHTQTHTWVHTQMKIWCMIWGVYKCTWVNFIVHCTICNLMSSWPYSPCCSCTQLCHCKGCHFKLMNKPVEKIFSTYAYAFLMVHRKVESSADI